MDKRRVIELGRLVGLLWLIIAAASIFAVVYVALMSWE